MQSVETEQMISGANPVTYMEKDGKQYAVAAGTRLLTYTLPQPVRTRARAPRAV